MSSSLTIRSCIYVVCPCLCLPNGNAGQARPAEALTLEGMEFEACRRFDGDVRRLLNIVKVTVICRGPREAAAFCRKLKQHPQVRSRHEGTLIIGYEVKPRPI